MANKELKEALGLDKSKKIAADYNIPFFVHEQDMCRLDLSHKRIEKWLCLLIAGLSIAIITMKGKITWKR